MLLFFHSTVFSLRRSIWEIREGKREGVPPMDWYQTWLRWKIMARDWDFCEPFNCPIIYRQDHIGPFSQLRALGRLRRHSGRDLRESQQSLFPSFIAGSRLPKRVLGEGTARDRTYLSLERWRAKELGNGAFNWRALRSRILPSFLQAIQPVFRTMRVGSRRQDRLIAGHSQPVIQIKNL